MTEFIALPGIARLTDWDIRYKQRLKKEVESSSEYREALEIERSILRDVARRHTDAERNIDGKTTG